MNSLPTCPKCGKPLPASAPRQLCPECLLRAGFPTGTQPAPTQPALAPPAPAELAPHFPQLEILECIGAGGMGAVYRARQPALDRLVALKILRPPAGDDPGFAERFVREARALAKLSHPNIVAVHDYGQTGGHHYLLMEFVDGMNLRQLLNAGTISPKEALAIVPPVCEALQYAHDQGIVHRDIKPENILLGKNGTVKLADFGLAKLAGAAGASLTAVGDVMGTPHYMAPEQVEKPREVDHRADIYSLGVVFYQMLTGELPLGRFGPPSRKVQIDVRLDEIVLRALEKEPELRYQQASGLKTAVESVSGAERPAAPPAPAAGPSAETERLIRLPSVALLVLGASELVGAMFVLALSIAARSGLATTVALLVALPEICLGVMLVLAGGIWMRRLRHYSWCVAGAIMAIAIPQAFHVWLVSALVGVWALLVLVRPDVRGAFAAVASDSVAPRRITTREKLVAAAAFVLLAAVWVGYPILLPSRPAPMTRILPTPLPRLISVYGRVTDAVTGEPIAGARIADNGYRMQPGKPVAGTTSDSEGVYRFTTYDEVHLIAASAPGYETKLDTLVARAIQGIKETHMDFQLKSTGDGKPAPAVGIEASPAMRAGAPRTDAGAAPIDFDRMESNPKILQTQLRLAHQKFVDAEASRQSGVGSDLEVLAAKTTETLLQARLTGDRVTFAHAQLDLAEARLKLVRSRFDAGLTTEAERDDAEAEVEIAKLRLRPVIATGAAPSAPDATAMLTEFDQMESNPEILQVQLRLARQKLTETEARYQTGVITKHDLLEAQRDIALLQARLTGDRVEFARVKLATAEDRLQLISVRYDVGLTTAAERDTAQAEVEIARLRLREVTPAESKP